MKKQSELLFIKIGKEAFADLTSQVKETIAIGFVKSGHKNFTVANLWNVQRQMKMRVQRRYL